MDSEHWQAPRAMASSVTRGPALGICAVIVNGAGAVIALYLLLGIVPKFAKLFDSLGEVVPWSTRVVVTLSTFLAANAFVLSVIYGAVALALIRARRRWPLRSDLLALAHGMVLIAIGPLCVVAIFSAITELQRRLAD